MGFSIAFGWVYVSHIHVCFVNQNIKFRYKPKTRQMDNLFDLKISSKMEPKFSISDFLYKIAIHLRYYHICCTSNHLYAIQHTYLFHISDKQVDLHLDDPSKLLMLLNVWMGLRHDVKSISINHNFHLLIWFQQLDGFEKQLLYFKK